MTKHVVTWKKIAEKANDMYPIVLRPPNEEKPVDTGPVEYIAARVNKGTNLEKKPQQKGR